MMVSDAWLSEWVAPGDAAMPGMTGILACLPKFHEIWRKMLYTVFIQIMQHVYILLPLGNSNAEHMKHFTYGGAMGRVSLFVGKRRSGRVQENLKHWTTPVFAGPSYAIKPKSSSSGHASLDNHLCCRWTFPVHFFNFTHITHRIDLKCLCCVSMYVTSR